MIACSYCGKAAYPCLSERIRNHKTRGKEAPDNFPNRARITTCGSCRKPLPKCIICRHHYGSIVDSIALFSDTGSSIDHAFVFCAVRLLLSFLVSCFLKLRLLALSSWWTSASFKGLV